MGTSTAKHMSKTSKTAWTQQIAKATCEDICIHVRRHMLLSSSVWRCQSCIEPCNDLQNLCDTRDMGIGMNWDTRASFLLHKSHSKACRIFRGLSSVACANKVLSPCLYQTSPDKVKRLIPKVSTHQHQMRDFLDLQVWRCCWSLGLSRSCVARISASNASCWLVHVSKV